MKQVVVVAMTLTLVSTLLSGCVLEDLFGEDASGTFVRTVDLIMDEDAIQAMERVEGPEDALQALGSTTYTYTHGAGELEVSTGAVRFIDDNGREREKALSVYTGASTLKKGDTVVIDEVALYSPIELISDGKTVAARGTKTVDWFESEGYPMPMAGSPGDMAEWDIQTAIKVGILVDHFLAEDMGQYDDYDCYFDENDEYQCDTTPVETTQRYGFDDLDFSADMVFDLGLKAEVRGGAETELRWDVDGGVTLDADLDMDLHYEDTTQREGEEPEGDDWSGPAGFALDNAGIDFDGLMKMFFDDQQLVRVGGQGSASSHIDGLRVWYDEHPKSENWSPDTDEFLFSESSDYEEEDIEGDEEDAIGPAAQMLADLWAMDLAVGDAFTIRADIDEEDGGIDFSYELAVTAKENKAVAGKSYESYRLDGDSNLDIRMPGGETESFDFKSFTFWVTTDGYLPVFAEMTHGTTLTQDDFQWALDLIEEEAGDAVELPEDITLMGEVTTSLALVDASGSLRMAAPVSVSGLFLAPWMIGLSAASFGLVSDLGGYDDYGYEDNYGDVPQISFTADLDDGTLTVVSVDAGVSWYDVDAYGCDDIDVGTIQAGDVIENCQGSVTVEHWPSGTMLYAKDFN